MQSSWAEHSGTVTRIFRENVAILVVQVAQNFLDVFLLDGRIVFGFSFD